jgi:hypothetical protein
MDHSESFRLFRVADSISARDEKSPAEGGQHVMSLSCSQVLRGRDNARSLVRAESQ